MRKISQIYTICFVLLTLLGCNYNIRNTPKGTEDVIIDSSQAPDNDIHPSTTLGAHNDNSQIDPENCSEITDKGLPSSEGEKTTDGILYLQGTDKGNGDTIWILSTTNGKQRLLTSSNVQVIDIGFTDIGSEYVFITLERDVILGNIDNGSTSTIQVDEQFLRNFSPYSYLWLRLHEWSGKQNFPGKGSLYNGDDYSPNGKRIARYKYGDASLQIINTDNNTKKTVIDTPIGPNGEVDTIDGEWSNDSRRYFFSRTYFNEEDKQIQSQIFSVDEDGGDLQSLLDPIQNAVISSLKISPDGTGLAFKLLNLSSNPEEEIGVLEIKSSIIRYFTPSHPIELQISNSLFDWSPNNDMIAYLVNSNKVSISVLDIITGKNYCFSGSDNSIREIDWK